MANIAISLVSRVAREHMLTCIGSYMCCDRNSTERNKSKSGLSYYLQLRLTIPTIRAVGWGRDSRDNP